MFDPSKPGQTAVLRGFLTRRFDEMGIRSYYYEAADNSAFPYAVFDLRHLDTFDDSAGSRTYEMEINVYNKGSDVVLENMLDCIEAELTGTYKADKFSLSVALGFRRIDMPEPVPLKRKRILFDLKYWYKECLV